MTQPWTDGEQLNAAKMYARTTELIQEAAQGVWTPITPDSSFSVPTDANAPEMMLAGGRVYFHGQIRTASGDNFAANTLIVLVTALPSAYWPDHPVNAVCASGGARVVRGVVSTTGLLQIVTPTDTSNYVDLYALSGYLAAVS